MAGRRPQLRFRGLLKLCSRYGLQGCSPTLQWTLSRGLDPAGYPTGPLVSYHVYRQLHGWGLPPLVICAVGAHMERTLAIWNDTAFERKLKDALKNELGDENGDEYFSRYVVARTTLLEDVLPQICGKEPNLTDHGPDHVRNVLNNVSDLLQGAPDYFKIIELYLLGLGVLFHDVGNLEGRSEHNRRIARFYDFVRQGIQFAQEKSLVVQISQAHSGNTQTGTRNTLVDVPKSSHLDGQPVRPREIAAIIRFADELAEGPQRTSQYLRKTGGHATESVLYHDYSSATHMCIDCGNERIAVTYQFEVSFKAALEKELERIKGLLNFTYERLGKMDLERRYARFHCAKPLLPFREISVRLDVQIDGEFLDLGLETIISDEVNLDRSAELLSERDSRWHADAVVNQLREEAKRRARNGQ